MGIRDVAFVMYPVSDMQRAVAFYRDALGLKQAGLASDAWVEFEVGSTTFGVGNFEQVGKPGSAQSFAMEVVDLPTLRANLQKRGVEVTEPYDMGACSVSVVRDPDGNQVWLHQVKSASS